MRTEDVSIIVNTWGPRPATAEEMIDVTVHAEELGFYSVGLTHLPILPHADENPPPHLAFIPRQYQDWYIDPLIVLPMMAKATSRIRIGFNVFITAWVHPFVSAKYLASLDVVSGGRLIAGFGLGVAPPPLGICKSLEHIGIGSRDRGQRSSEALEIIARLWTSSAPVTFTGRYYTATDLVVDPKPLQKPMPEVWWAGSGEPSIDRAARYGRYLELAWATPERIKDYYVPRLRAVNQRHGGHAGIALWVPFTLIKGPDASDDTLSQIFWGVGGEQLAGFIGGSVRQCARKLQCFRDAGVDHVVVDLHRHGLDHVGVVHEQMELLVKEVLPLVTS
jgi:alkanesulfonate monooxygenase SsuD/methylene tetrahydromethanopterin reductase-like flavin-dependent oxidoreductase (luciferase family)